MLKKIKKTVLSIFILTYIFIPYILNAESGWYWTNSNKQIRGKDGLSAKIPFSSLEECQKNLDSFMSGSTYYDKNVVKCFKMENEEVVKNKEAEKENLLTDETKKDVADIQAQKEKKIRDETYTLLAPFGNKLTEVKDGVGIGPYLNQMFYIGIGVAGALAVIMIVVNGVLYMGNESVFGKTKAKERIIMAIGGLVLLLGSWVILRTINPDLVGGKLSLKKANIAIVSDPADLDIDEKTGFIDTSCASLKKDPGRYTNLEQKKKTEQETLKNVKLVDLRELGFKVKNNSLIQEDLASKLKIVVSNLGMDYSITEAFKATTYDHESPCHYKASCVDFAFRRNGSPIKASKEEVLQALSVFRNTGLFAQFEVGSIERLNELGYTSTTQDKGKCSNIIVVNGVAEHFSVYLKK